MKKSYLAIIMAIMMVFCLSFGAFADEGNVAKIGAIEYPTIEAAVEEADDGQTIVLLKDVNLGEKTVTINKELTLDLKTFTISGTGNKVPLEDGSGKSTLYPMLRLENEVKITSSATSGKGTVKMATPTGEYAIVVTSKNADVTLENVDILAGVSTINAGNDRAGYGVQVNKGGKLTVNNNTNIVGGFAPVTVLGNLSGNAAYEADTATKLIVNDGSTLEGGWYGIAGNGTYDNTTITINGGEITSGETGIYHPQVGNLTIHDGSITGLNGVQYCGAGQLNIDGGEITATYEYTEFPTKSHEENDGSSNDGSAISLISRGAGYQGADSKINVTITNGIFTSENNSAISVYRLSKDETGKIWKVNDESNVTTSYLNSLNITGGTFVGDEAKGAMVIDDLAKSAVSITDATFEPALPASITVRGITTYYLTLEDAIEAARNEETINLKSGEIAISSPIAIRKDITLEGAVAEGTPATTIKAAADYTKGVNEQKAMISFQGNPSTSDREGDLTAGRTPDIKNIIINGNDIVAAEIGLQCYDGTAVEAAKGDGTSYLTLTATNVTVQNTQNYGVSVNGATLNATGLTVDTNGGYHYSVAVTPGIDVTTPSVFNLAEPSDLDLPIYVGKPANAQVNLPEKYKKIYLESSEFYTDDPTMIDAAFQVVNAEGAISYYYSLDDALKAAKVGETVKLPAGETEISESIVITKGITLEGAVAEGAPAEGAPAEGAPATTIKVAEGYNIESNNAMVSFQGTVDEINASIKNVVIDGAKGTTDNKANVGLQCYDNTDTNDDISLLTLNAENVKIQNTKNYGVSVVSANFNATKLEVEESASNWYSINVGPGSKTTNKSTLTIDEASVLAKTITVDDLKNIPDSVVTAPGYAKIVETVGYTSGSSEYKVTHYTKDAAVYGAAEAKIGETYYKTLPVAMEAAKTNDIVVLNKDVALTEQLEYDKTGVNVTLNLNGKKLTVTEEAASVVAVKAGGLTIADSSEAANGTIEGKIGVIIEGGTLTTTGGTIKGTNGSAISLNDATVATVEIKGGTLTSVNGNVIGGTTSTESTSTVAISGGTLTAESGKNVIAVDENTTVSVTGGNFSPLLKSTVTTAPLANNVFNEEGDRVSTEPIYPDTYTASYGGSTIYLTAKTVPWHTNGAGTPGNWVGVAIGVPQYMNYDEIKTKATYKFAASAAAAANLTAKQLGEVTDTNTYNFYPNASASDAKTYIEIDWDGAGSMAPVIYNINLSNVVCEPEPVEGQGVTITAVENINSTTDSDNDQVVSEERNKYSVSDSTVATLKGNNIELTGTLPYVKGDTADMGMSIEGCSRFAIKLFLANVNETDTISVTNGETWNTYNLLNALDSPEGAANKYIYLVGDVNNPDGKMEVIFNKGVEGKEAVYTVTWADAVLSTENVTIAEGATSEVPEEIEDELSDATKDFLAATDANPAPTENAIPLVTVTGIANAVKETVIEKDIPEVEAEVPVVEIGVNVTVLPDTDVEKSVLAFKAEPYKKVTVGSVAGDPETLTNDDLKGKEAITLRFALPANFITDGLQVRHIKDNGDTEYLIPEIEYDGDQAYAIVTIFDFSTIIIENKENFTVEWVSNLPDGVVMDNPYDIPEVDVSKLPYNLEVEGKVATARGYEFAYWSVANDNQQVVKITAIDGATINAYANNNKQITIYANWTTAASTVTFDADNGTDPTVQKVAYGENAIKPADPTKAGYTFAGWYADGAGETGEAYEFSTPVNGDLTLKAKWNAATYNVILAEPRYTDPEDDEHFVEIIYQRVPCTYGVGIPEDDFMDDYGFMTDGTDYEFFGWYEDPKFESEQVTSISEEQYEDITLYGKLERVYYHVVYIQSGAEPRDVKVSVEDVVNETVKVAALPSADGKVFNGWFDDEGTTVTPEDVITEDKFNSDGRYYLNAYGDTVSYAVGFVTNGGSYVEPLVVEHGAKATAPTAPTREGFTFEGWYTDEALTTAANFDSEITANTTFYAKWAAVEPAIVYEDVNSDDWFYDEVMAVTENGCMNGFVVDGKNYFRPNEATTRAQFVTMLGRYDQVDTEAYKAGDYSFTDVTGSTATWAGSYIAWASANKIVEGTSATTFEPSKTISRQEMATIIGRYLSYKEYDAKGDWNSVNFTDKGSIATWAQDGVADCVATGLITGFEEGDFRPSEEMTRAQGATVLSRIMDLLK